MTDIAQLLAKGVALSVKKLESEWSAHDEAEHNARVALAEEIERRQAVRQPKKLRAIPAEMRESDISDDARRWIKRNVERRGDDECWPIRGAQQGRYTSKYNRSPRTGLAKSQQVHRMICALSGKIINAGWVVMHTCDDTTCGNPEHLVPGTYADNYNDMVTKGRGAGQVSRRHDR